MARAEAPRPKARSARTSQPWQRMGLRQRGGPWHRTPGGIHPRVEAGQRKKPPSTRQATVGKVKEAKEAHHGEHAMVSTGARQNSHKRKTERLAQEAAQNPPSAQNGTKEDAYMPRNGARGIVGASGKCQPPGGPEET
ncbi:hypothetical protein V6N12_019240 [Hibiscus sabdariffa]|uniref:Uncharacterized protein n=1 Tax=Hibiscus sabdariffa TaxID=183260 RepID=A0ABR2C716_9ROSI